MNKGKEKPSYAGHKKRVGYPCKLLFYIDPKFIVVIILASINSDGLRQIQTHYIHSVVLQDFVLGRAYCVNQYHYEWR